MSDARDRARELARHHIGQGRPTGWFEELYAEAAGDAAHIPWADLRPNPHLESWCEREQQPRPSARVVVIGAGLGDDAEYLAARGAGVTAFDVSPTAITWCEQRFPRSRVEYRVEDLLAYPAGWRRAFELVVEIFTVQALPVELRARALEAVAELVAPAGRLLVVCRARDPGEALGELPWPLLRSELESLTSHGLSVGEIENVMSPDDPPVRRFRASFHRP